MNLMDKWRDLVGKINSKGIPLPMVRDPKTGQGSITASLVIMSSGLCGIIILVMLGTCLAKLKSDFVLNAGTEAEVHDAFVSSLQFFVASLGAYLGRKMQSDGKGSVVLNSDDKTQT